MPAVFLRFSNTTLLPSFLPLSLSASLRLAAAASAEAGLEAVDKVADDG